MGPAFPRWQVLGSGRGLPEMSGDRRAARTRATAATHEHQVRRPPRVTPTRTAAAAQVQVGQPPRDTHFYRGCPPSQPQQALQPS